MMSRHLFLEELYPPFGFAAGVSSSMKKMLKLLYFLVRCLKRGLVSDDSGEVFLIVLMLVVAGTNAEAEGGKRCLGSEAAVAMAGGACFETVEARAIAAATEGIVARR